MQNIKVKKDLIGKIFGKLIVIERAKLIFCFIKFKI